MRWLWCCVCDVWMAIIQRISDGFNSDVGFEAWQAASWLHYFTCLLLTNRQISKVWLISLETHGKVTKKTSEYLEAADGIVRTRRTKTKSTALISRLSVTINLIRFCSFGWLSITIVFRPDGWVSRSKAPYVTGVFVAPLCIEISIFSNT